MNTYVNKVEYEMKHCCFVASETYRYHLKVG